MTTVNVRRALRGVGKGFAVVLGLLVDALVAVLWVLKAILPGSGMIAHDYESLQEPARRFADEREQERQRRAARDRFRR